MSSVSMNCEVLINADRLWQSLMDLAQIGATPGGGVARLALTDLDRQARELFTQWCQAAGCSVRTDAIGNLIARRPGRSDGPAVMMGSHIDSQPNGGKFDGAYGVMAGLEVLRALHDAGALTEKPIEVVAWTNEEGSRFSPSMMGSAVYAGLMPLEQTLSITDQDGITVEQALRAIGVTSTALETAYPDAYFEAHIEQGPVLEAEGKVIGVVTGTQGQCWYQIELDGRASHAGTTPMGLRADALVGAADIILKVQEFGRANAPGMGTVGRMVVSPNSPNVIPDHVYLTAEIRHPDDAVRRVMDTTLTEAIRDIADRQGLKVRVNKVLEQPAAPFDPACVAMVRDSAQRRNYSYRDIISGASHDAVAMSRIVPTTMVFVPCAGGISHNEKESATPDDLAAGCQVLCDVVIQRAGLIA